jgi:hypothetical protein
MSQCKICKRELNNPSDIGSEDQGGDCLECMAFLVGDSDAESRMLIKWAYSKLHHICFNKIDDALMLDRMKEYLC